MKDYIIVFEGIDRAGKTTARKMFNRASNYQHVTIDRCFLSSIVYDKEIRKVNTKKKWLSMATKMSRAFSIVNVVIVPTSKKVEAQTRRFRPFVEKFNLAANEFLLTVPGSILVEVFNDSSLRALNEKMVDLAKLVKERSL